MFGELFKFFKLTVFTGSYSGAFDTLNSRPVNLFGYDIYLIDYLSYMCALVSLIIIVVLCCLFIYRLIRVVSRLFMGA